MAIGNVATQLGIGDIIAKVAMPIMTNLSTLGFFGTGICYDILF